MQVTFRVQGASHDAIKAAAATTAAGYAGDLPHTVTIGEVYGEFRFDPDEGEQGVNEGGPAKFLASVTVDVDDPELPTDGGDGLGEDGGYR